MRIAPTSSCDEQYRICGYCSQSLLSKLVISPVISSCRVSVSFLEALLTRERKPVNIHFIVEYIHISYLVIFKCWIKWTVSIVITSFEEWLSSLVGLHHVPVVWFFDNNMEAIDEDVNNPYCISFWLYATGTHRPNLANTILSSWLASSAVRESEVVKITSRCVRRCSFVVDGTSNDKDDGRICVIPILLVFYAG